MVFSPRRRRQLSAMESTQGRFCQHWFDAHFGQLFRRVLGLYESEAQFQSRASPPPAWERHVWQRSIIYSSRGAKFDEGTVGIPSLKPTPHMRARLGSLILCGVHFPLTGASTKRCARWKKASTRREGGSREHSLTLARRFESRDSRP